MALVYDHTFKDKYRKATATRTLELDGATTLIGTAPSAKTSALSMAPPLSKKPTHERPQSNRSPRGRYRAPTVPPDADSAARRPLERADEHDLRNGGREPDRRNL